MNRPPDTEGLTLTAGDVVAIVAQQIEVSGARPVLTNASKHAAERAAEELLGTLTRRANGAEHDSD